MPMPFSDVRMFTRDTLRLLMERALGAPPGLVPLYLQARPIWLATDPGLARQVLKWPRDEIEKGKLFDNLKPVMGSSLLTNVGQAHTRTKAGLNRHVNKTVAARHLREMLAAIDTFIRRFAEERDINTSRTAAPLALELACIALFGREVITTDDQLALIKAVQTVEAELAADMFRVLPRWPWVAAARTRQLEGARRAVADVVARARGHDERSDIITGLEEAGLSDDEIGAEILGLFIAGHHTTGAAIAWTMYHLARNPEIAERVSAEAEAILPAIESGDATALRRAPVSLNYVREVLRVYPPAFWTTRELYKPTTVHGRKLRRGDQLMVAWWTLHRDPRFWDEPEVFRIDRDYGLDAYMPFGIGPRACIGQSIAWFELQLVALKLAAALAFELPANAETPQPKPSIALGAPPILPRAVGRGGGGAPGRVVA
jgi:cytochrome P450